MANLLARLNPFCKVDILTIHIDKDTREVREMGTRTLTLPVKHLAFVWSCLELVWHRRSVRLRPDDMWARLLLAHALSHTNQDAAAKTEYRRVAASSDSESAAAARRMLNDWFGEAQ